MTFAVVTARSAVGLGPMDAAQPLAGLDPDRQFAEATGPWWH